MKSKPLILFFIACGLILTLDRLPQAQTAPQDRISSPIDSSSLSVVQHNISPLAKPQFDQGEVEGSFKLSHMTMHFKLTDIQQDALNTLMRQQQDPASANYHQWLTPEQYAGRFGLSQSDFAKVVAWLEQQGFSIDESARSRSWVAFTGSAEQVAAAFHTEIHRYAVRGRMHYANAVEPSIPSALTGVVEGIRSLDDFRPQAKSIRRRINAGTNPRFTSSTSGNHYIAPADFRRSTTSRAFTTPGSRGRASKLPSWDKPTSR